MSDEAISLEDGREETSNEITNMFRPPQSIYELGAQESGSILLDVIGYNINRRLNLFLIEDDVLVYTTGAAVVFLNLNTRKKEYLLGLDEGGVGAIAIHPSRKRFAVGGLGFQPRIVIYTYPKKEVIKVLIMGAERGYSSLYFNTAGNKLASVTTSPDFLLTVWDWEQQAVALHCKAFGQDVYSVKFSQDDDRRLTTSGVGHIRFWKMASTFTGLKLQGYIGKFGKVDLSDVCAFAELPDGKVVSGSETGDILLWEGNFIKCRFVRTDPTSPRMNDTSPRSRYSIVKSPRSNKIMCHNGEINYVDLDRIERCLITAGMDGWIRWWDFDVIDNAEVDTDVTMDFELTPKAEYYHGIGIIAMVDSTVIDGLRYFVIIDQQSNLSVVTFPITVSLVSEVNAKIVPKKKHFGVFHSGKIVSCITDPTRCIVATSGTDGTVRLVNYEQRKVIASRGFNIPATCMKWIPSTFQSKSCFFVGFEDGTVRIFSSKNSCLSMTLVLKPHVAAVTSFSFSGPTQLAASAGKDGSVWFFSLDNFQETNKLEALRFVVPIQIEGGKKANTFCESISWDSSGYFLLCVCSDHILREIDVTNLIEMKDCMPVNFETYLTTLPVHEYPVKIQVAVQETVAKSAPGSPVKAERLGALEEDNDEDVVKVETEVKVTFHMELMNAKVLSAVYASEHIGGRRKVIIGCKVNERNVFGEFVLDMMNSFVEMSIGLHSSDGKERCKAPIVTFVDHSLSKAFVLVGADDGTMNIRSSKSMQTFVRLTGHHGAVTSISMSYDERYVISTGVDGTMVLHSINPDVIATKAQSLWNDIDAGIFEGNDVKPFSKSDNPITSVTSTMDENSMLSLLGLPSTDDCNELPPGSYSIEDQKQQLGMDALLEKAEIEKNKTRELLHGLQREYKSILNENNELPETARLQSDDLVLDPEYVELLKAEGEERLEDVRKLCAYETERAEKLKEKLYRRLMGSILVEQIPLYDLSYPDPKYSHPPAEIKVLSLRTASMHPIIEHVLLKVRQQQSIDAMVAKKQKAGDIVDGYAQQAINDVKSKYKCSSFDVGAVIGGEKDKENSGPKGSGPSERRAGRLKRKMIMGEHIALKPIENQDDPRDLEAIKIAEETIGDFKAKVSEDYVLPSHKVLNAVSKLNQLVLLEESAVIFRLQFNEKFLALRLLKKELIKSIQKENHRLREIDYELGQPERSANLWEPVLDPNEFPDDRDEVTEEELIAFKKCRETIPWIKAVALPNSTVTGHKTKIQTNLATGEYIVIHKPDERNSPEVPDGLISQSDSLSKRYYEVDNFILASFAMKNSTASRFQALENSIPSLAFAKESLVTLVTNSSKFSSPVAVSTIRDRACRLAFEREMILKNISIDTTNFRKAIEQLRLSRHETIANIKLIELKMLVLYQEYQLLKTFETKDSLLQSKQAKCKKEKLDIVTSLQELNEKYELKVLEGKDWLLKLSVIQTDVNDLVPSTHPCQEMLLKIFKKKIRLKKENENDDDAEDEEEEEESEDDEDDDEIQDICPPNCDKGLYASLINLRTARVEIQDQYQVVSKATEDIRRNLDKLKQKEKQIEKDAKYTDFESQQFQMSKLLAMNQIEICIPLNVEQIYPFERSGILSGPNDSSKTEDQDSDISILLNSDLRHLVDEMAMNTHVIIHKEDLARLHSRIGDLGQEIEAAKSQLKTLYKRKIYIEKSLQTQRIIIQGKKKACLDVQIMKFGKEIDIDDLEAKSDKNAENEIEAEINIIEFKWKQKQAMLVKEQELLTDKLIEVTKKNTELLANIGGLTGSKLAVQRELNKVGLVSTGDEVLADAAEKAERERCSIFVKHQEREIQMLRNEIALLNRKDIQQPLPYLPQRSQTAPNQKSTPLLPPLAYGLAAVARERPKSNYASNTKSARK